MLNMVDAGVRRAALFVTVTAVSMSTPIWALDINNILPNGELLRPALHSIENDSHSPLPYTYIREEDLPKEFDWRNVSGVSYVTRSLNQHIPQVRTWLQMLCDIFRSYSREPLAAFVARFHLICIFFSGVGT